MEDIKVTEEKVLLTARGSFKSLIGTIITVAIFIAAGIVILCLMDDWNNDICEAIRKAMIESKIKSNGGKISEAEALNIAQEVFEQVSTYKEVFKWAFYCFGCASIAIPSIILFEAILKLAVTHLTLTDQRIFGKTGLGNVKKIDLKISEVSVINITTTFGGSILGYDNVEITNKTFGVTTTFKAITNATEIKNAIATIKYYSKNKPQ